MGDTKERIMRTSMELFAKKGYEAVSVSDIAGALGVTKGALYRHFDSKRAIFEAILQCMEQRDGDQARGHTRPQPRRTSFPSARPCFATGRRTPLRRPFAGC